ncbi:unnamed protein product [Staurois parvus]|uniref:Uncharacterized protein n=1 Tax=Staurois parvus TaxID=386267 RepID=A0ABN9GNV3_9NEOB|nr:unnamed protein product [Staurois parvus]
MYTDTCKHTHTCTYTQTHVQIHTCTYTQTHVHAYTDIHKHVHTCTHAVKCSILFPEATTALQKVAVLCCSLTEPGTAL